MWWKRPRYQAVIVGEESGVVTPLPFVDFRRERDAKDWVAMMNTERADDSVHFDYRSIAKKGQFQ